MKSVMYLNTLILVMALLPSTVFQVSQWPQGYPDYFAKMSTYATILSGPAAVLQPGISPKIFRTPDETEMDSVFNYIDTASDRAGIGKLSEKLEGEIVSIIGTGGTGSYIIDLVSKTPVREIRLFDADEFLQHNAFRAPELHYWRNFVMHR